MDTMYKIRLLDRVSVGAVATGIYYEIFTLKYQ
jgi:hypothetical protein